MPDGNNGGDPQNNNGGDPQNKNQNGFESFEAFLEKQPKEVKDLYESHTTGLKNSLTKAREERDNSTRLLRELQQKAEKGSDLEKQLSDAVEKAEAAERRALFAEGAITPEIRCVNVKAAYALAITDDLFKKDGSPDWESIKKAAPELFKKPGNSTGGAGDGTGEDGGPKMSMNDILRSHRRRE